MDYMKRFRYSKPIRIKKQEEELNTAEECYICKNRFTRENYKVRALSYNGNI